MAISTSLTGFSIPRFRVSVRYRRGTTVSLETEPFFAVCHEPDNGFVFLIVADQCKFFADYRDREQVASRGGTPLLQGQGN